MKEEVPVLAQLLLPDPVNLELGEVLIEDDVVILAVSSRRRKAICPDCSRPSQRVHSRYWRAVADLPCGERRVQLNLLVRRLFCDNAMCKRKTFAEGFPGIVAPNARRTDRLAARQRRVGLALGGEAGSQMLIAMGMPLSGDTTLRLTLGMQQEAVPPPRVLGIDDWAWCKGQCYGTILVDLERHCPIDLLPDRTSDTLVAWLQAHPGVEVVSRDRAPAYIDAINRGAPDAIQVADRWHLLRNLRDVLERVLEQNRDCLYAAACQLDDQPDPESTFEHKSQDEIEDDTPQTKAEQRRQAARERRLERYQAVVDLHQQGVKIRAIACQLGMGRKTVRRYIESGVFPETSIRKKRLSILNRYKPYLNERWSEGCHNGLQLYREIKEQGYSGSRSLLGHWVARMRKRELKPVQREKAVPDGRKRANKPWSAHYAVWLLLRDPETLSPDKQAALERMLAASPAVRQAYNFGQSFIRIVRHRFSRALEPWLTAVMDNKVSKLSGFAQSLKQDKDAILAALSLPWSNGQVEGQVNRLKLIKRQMYGRAKFDLLRARVLTRIGD
jgi:transposase